MDAKAMAFPPPGVAASSRSYQSPFCRSVQQTDLGNVDKTCFEAPERRAEGQERRPQAGPPGSGAKRPPLRPPTPFPGGWPILPCSLGCPAVCLSLPESVTHVLEANARPCDVPGWLPHCCCPWLVKRSPWGGPGRAALGLPAPSCAPRLPALHQRLPPARLHGKSCRSQARARSPPLPQQPLGLSFSASSQPSPLGLPAQGLLTSVPIQASAPALALSPDVLAATVRTTADGQRLEEKRGPFPAHMNGGCVLPQARQHHGACSRAHGDVTGMWQPSSSTGTLIGPCALQHHTWAHCHVTS